MNNERNHNLEAADREQVREGQSQTSHQGQGQSSQEPVEVENIESNETRDILETEKNESACSANQNQAKSE